MPEIEFTIREETGEMELEVEGVQGPACADIAKLVTDLVGAPARGEHERLLRPPADRSPSATEEKLSGPQQTTESEKKGGGDSMAEATWIIDQATGELTVEGLTARETASLTADLLAGGQPVNCARPAGAPPLNSQKVQSETFEPTLRVYRIYHNSVVEGPGRRSVVQLAGCLLRCPGCYVPETHDPQGGVELTVSEIVELLLDQEGSPRDGVTVLGGEPFLHPEGLAVLLGALKMRGLHVTLYTGYTLETLRSRKESAVAEALALADILIDGPFVAQLSRHAGEWRGSTNQRIIYRPASTVTP